MAGYSLHLNRPALHGVGIDRARTLVNRVVRRTYNRSAVLCPVDTGNMRSTGVMLPATVRGSVVVGGVVYTAEYTAAVHEGRRALTIRARNRKVLRFIVNGRVVFARQVHQPARKGRPFLADALREVARSEGFRMVSVG
jgi:hypothetical protein